MKSETGSRRPSGYCEALPNPRYLQWKGCWKMLEGCFLHCFAFNILWFSFWYMSVMDKIQPASWRFTDTHYMPGSDGSRWKYGWHWEKDLRRVERAWELIREIGLFRVPKAHWDYLKRKWIVEKRCLALPFHLSCCRGWCCGLYLGSLRPKGQNTKRWHSGRKRSLWTARLQSTMEQLSFSAMQQRKH